MLLFIHLWLFSKSNFFFNSFILIFLSPHEFGLANEIIAITSFFILLFNFGLDEAAVRFYFPFRNDKFKDKRF